MKCTSYKVQMHLLLPAVLAAFALPVLQGEPRCPGNIASVTPRFVQPGLIVVPVRINQKVPFDFMVDTGSQMTLVDPSLASELHLKLQGTVGLLSVANYGQAPTTVLDRLEADSHVVEKPLAIVQDLGPIRAADPLWQELQQVTAWAVIGRKERQAFSVLPPQDIRIGTRTLRQISFITPVSISQNFPTRDEDGLLPTMLFQRVFINLADHYVVFDPR